MVSLLLQVPTPLRFYRTDRTAGFSILLPCKGARLKVRYCASVQAKWALQPQFHTAFRALNKTAHAGVRLSGWKTYRTDIPQTFFSKVSALNKLTGIVGMQESGHLSFTWPLDSLKTSNLSELDECIYILDWLFAFKRHFHTYIDILGKQLAYYVGSLR